MTRPVELDGKALLEAYNRLSESAITKFSPKPPTKSPSATGSLISGTGTYSDTPAYVD